VNAGLRTGEKPENEVPIPQREGTGVRGDRNLAALAGREMPV